MYYSFKTYVVIPSLEPSHRDGSNEGSQQMFLLRNKKIYVYPPLSGAHQDGSYVGSQHMFLSRNYKSYL